MSSPQFDIVFRGVRAGFDPELVKNQFANLFKLEPAKVDRIFKSRNVTLKNHADERLANIFVARLLAIGVHADKLPVERLPSKAIYLKDSGEVATDAHPMHQPVEFLYGEHIRRIPFVFNGSGLEYLKLWLVNLLACILSAGILYPWAKVRSLRYFYQRTHLDNVEFFYTSNPQKIFLVQFALSLYLAGLAYAFFRAPLICLIGGVILIAVLPYYWLKRSTFEQQHSLYCDTHFQKKSDLRETYKIFLLWPLIAVLTAGLAAPYAIFKIQQHRVESISIGGYAFSFSGSFKHYLSLLPSLLIAEALSAACLYYREYLPFGFSVLLVAGLWMLVFIRWRVTLVNLQWNSINTKLGYFVANWDLQSYNALVTSNLILCIITAGCYWPWARIKSARYKSERLAFFANQRFAKWRRSVL
ncbi:DUF898 family protein [Cellvibrio zantedeschiae]|nr:DUF898 family protein [Cellvibrio zantedeschiae]